jgi:hypothetical protein
VGSLGHGVSRRSGSTSTIRRTKSRLWLRVEVVTMKRIKQVTPAEAAAVWNSIPNPSARRVARTLAQQGRPVHHTTVARWRARGWRLVVHGRHPIDAAQEALVAAARALTGNQAIGAEAFARQAERGEQLGDLSDREILRRAARDLLVLSVVLLRAEFLVQENMVKTAVLLKTVVTATQAASRALCQVHEWPEGQGWIGSRGRARRRHREASEGQGGRTRGRTEPRQHDR